MSVIRHLTTTLPPASPSADTDDADADDLEESRADKMVRECCEVLEVLLEPIEFSMLMSQYLDLMAQGLQSPVLPVLSVILRQLSAKATRDEDSLKLLVPSSSSSGSYIVRSQHWLGGM